MNNIISKTICFMFSKLPSKPPVRMVLSGHRYSPSLKIYGRKPKDEESIFALKGLRLIEIFKGDLTRLNAFASFLEKEHSLRIRFASNGNIIIFDSLCSGHCVAFKTETLKYGRLLKSQVGRLHYD